MSRPLSISPRPSSNPKLPWVVHIPTADRARYEGQARKYFRREGEANTFAKALRRQRSEHTAAFNDLPDTKKAEAYEALEILAPFPTARSLRELAQGEADRCNIAAKSKLLPEIITEMVAEKSADGRRLRYLGGLTQMCNLFARSFPDRLASSITGPEIAKWLRDSYDNPNSRDSYRRNVSVLFAFAKEKGYVGENPVTGTKAANARREEEVAILKPEELAALLRASAPRLRPYIVLSAFAALRPNEARQITWDYVLISGIYVSKHITKTVARHVPVLPALAAWLEHFGQQRGKVYGGSERTWRMDFDRARKEAGLFDTWVQDALRHSAISYWLAMEPNRAAVAMYSANSEDVQKRDYQNARSLEQALAWYAVLPTPENTPLNVRTWNKGGRKKRSVAALPEQAS